MQPRLSEPRHQGRLGRIQIRGILKRNRVVFRQRIRRAIDLIEGRGLRIPWGHGVKAHGPATGWMGSGRGVIQIMTLGPFQRCGIKHRRPANTGTEGRIKALGLPIQRDMHRLGPETASQARLWHKGL